jgi:mannose/fructose/N-acetylgalactosamine-specific phosphotransferase system component IID
MAFIQALKGFLGLLFLQTSWSFDGRQSLGFLTTLSWLLKNKEEREKFLHRFSRPFNSNPYAASYALGTILKEKERHQESVSQLLAAYGDDYFWHTIRPAFAGLAVLLGLAGAVWAPILFVILFNGVAQGVRFAGLPLAYARGRQAVLDFGRWVNRITPALQISAALVVGMLLFVFFHTFLIQGRVGYFSVPAFIFALPWLLRRLSPSYLFIIYLVLLCAIKLIL